MHNYTTNGLTVIPLFKRVNPSFTILSFSSRPLKTSKFPSFLIPVTISIFSILLSSKT